MNIFTYCATLVDLASKRTKSAEAVVKQGDWGFTQLGNYTSIAPLVVSSGTKTKITFQASDVSYQAGVGLVANYDFVSQKFLPSTLNDVFQVEVRMKVKPSSQDGHMDLLVESPTFGFNPINASSLSFVKGANQEHSISADFVLFIGSDVLTNGIEFYVRPNSTGVSIYDVSYMIVRLSSGKA